MTKYENDIRSEAVQNFIKTHGLELRKFHALGGPIHESVAFNAEVYKDGKKIADARDDGNGGGTFIDAHNGIDRRHWQTVEAIEAALKEAAIVWFISEFGDKKPHHWDLESLVTEMAMLLLEEKEWKAKTRTKVFVRTTDCKKNEFYTYKRNAKVSDKVRNAAFELFVVDAIVKRFGIDNIVEVRGLRTIDNWKEAAKKASATLERIRLSKAPASA
jgi:hypothetical protein